MTRSVAKATARSPVPRTAMRVALAEARRAHDRLAPQLRLDERTALGLVFVCQQWAQYWLLLGARGRWPNDGAIVAALEEARHAVRCGAADFGLLRPGRGLAIVGPSGADLELERLFMATRPGGRARPRPRATAGSTNKLACETALSREGDRPISRSTRRRR